MAQPLRIKKRKYFLMAADQGRKVVARGIIVYARPNERMGTRVGFTVTKKIGNAVVRNRLRRRLREVVRLSQEMDHMENFDIVIIGRQSAVDKPFTALQDDFSFVLRHLRKAHPVSEDKSSVPDKPQDDT